MTYAVLADGGGGGGKSSSSRSNSFKGLGDGDTLLIDTTAFSGAGNNILSAASAFSSDDNNYIGAALSTIEGGWQDDVAKSMKDNISKVSKIYSGQAPNLKACAEYMVRTSTETENLSSTIVGEMVK